MLNVLSQFDGTGSSTLRSNPVQRAFEIKLLELQIPLSFVGEVFLCNRHEVVGVLDEVWRLGLWFLSQELNLVETG